MDNSDNNRIAKNTLLLYLRMILLFVVSFYTTRVLLQELGIADFGLYNVVAGFVAMLGFMNQSMTNSIQRFLNFQLGKGSKPGVKKYFEVSLTTQILLAAILVLIFETFGLWFLNTKMTIPESKELSANIVFQLSFVSLLIGLVRDPYNAMIIAKEKMDFYAYVSIGEALLKLLIAFAVSWLPFDRLITYSVLLLLTTLFVYVCTVLYCQRLAPYLSFRLDFDKIVLKEVLSFGGWNLMGTASGMAKSQGINVLINMFFSVTVNAARGVAFQVLSGVQQFVMNFQVAINPQIIQSFSSNNKERYLRLTYLSAKISLYLMWLVTLPVILCIDDILNVWLGSANIPEYTAEFVIIVLFTGLFDSLGSSLSTSIYATGKIKSYQIIVSLIKIMVLPLSYVAYLRGAMPAAAMYISLTLAFFEQTLRVIIWCRLVHEPIVNYLKQVAIRGLVVIMLSYFVCFYLMAIINIESQLLTILMSVFISIVINIIIIVVFALNSGERDYLSSIVKSKIIK